MKNRPFCSAEAQRTKKSNRKSTQTMSCTVIYHREKRMWSPEMISHDRAISRTMPPASVSMSSDRRSARCGDSVGFMARVFRRASSKPMPYTPRAIRKSDGKAGERDFVREEGIEEKDGKKRTAHAPFFPLLRFSWGITCPKKRAYGSGMNKKRLSDDSQTASGPMSVAGERLNISNRVK